MVTVFIGAKRLKLITVLFASLIALLAVSDSGLADNLRA
jgi:hypothetical protein